MAEQWGMLYRTDTGEAYGDCTEDQLAPAATLSAKGLTFKRLSQRPDWINQEWDVATKTMRAAATSPQETQRQALIAKGTWTAADITAAKTLLGLVRFGR
jgi:hypothetical protein